MQANPVLADQYVAIAARSMVFASCLLDHLPALQLWSKDRVKPKSALVAFHSWLQATTERCVARLSEGLENVPQTVLGADSDDDDEAHAARRGASASERWESGAAGVAVWASSIDALQDWSSDAELALTALAAALGTRRPSSSGHSMFADIMAQLSADSAAPQPLADTDTDGDDEALVSERLATITGRLHFIPYALALLSELLDQLQRPLVSTRNPTAASNADSTTLAATVPPSATSGGEPAPDSEGGNQSGHMASATSGTAGGSPSSKDSAIPSPESRADAGDAAVQAAVASPDDQQASQEVRTETLTHHMFRNMNAILQFLQLHQAFSADVSLCEHVYSTLRVVWLYNTCPKLHHANLTGAHLLRHGQRHGLRTGRHEQPRFRSRW